MAGTFLEICQDVARECGVTVPDGVVGSSTENARRLLAHSQRAARRIMRDFDWQALVSEHTITTVATQNNYSLPSDFDRYIPGTGWDNTNYRPMGGPITPAQFQALEKSQLATAGEFRRLWRRRGGEILIYPTPSASSETLTLEYVSSHPWLDTDGTTTKASIAADTDTFRIDDEVLTLFMIAYMQRQLGEDYAQDMLDAEMMLESRQAYDQNYDGHKIGGGNGVPLIGDANIPEFGYGGS